MTMFWHGWATSCWACVSLSTGQSGSRSPCAKRQRHCSFSSGPACRCMPFAEELQQRMSVAAKRLLLRQPSCDAGMPLVQSCSTCRQLLTESWGLIVGCPSLALADFVGCGGSCRQDKPVKHTQHSCRSRQRAKSARGIGGSPAKDMTACSSLPHVRDTCLPQLQPLLRHYPSLHAIICVLSIHRRVHDLSHRLPMHHSARHGGCRQVSQTCKQPPVHCPGVG